MPAKKWMAKQVSRAQMAGIACDAAAADDDDDDDNDDEDIFQLREGRWRSGGIEKNKKNKKIEEKNKEEGQAGGRRFTGRVAVAAVQRGPGLDRFPNRIPCSKHFPEKLAKRKAASRMPLSRRSKKQKKVAGVDLHLLPRR
mmetsp:Transcript_58119/g.127489  ORF Transcript_58119/g.127489 Transcript_58119/m.127489 type:complete len:141 (-) Transcript_58119:621-1043(-)